MATNPPPDLVLTPLGGEARPLEEWLTTFHLATVVLDPYTNESSWILRTAARILEGLRGARRPGQLPRHRRASATPRRFLGPLVDQFLVFMRSRPRRRSRRSACRQLPAFVFIRVDGTVPAAAEGWNRPSGAAVADAIAEATAWLPPDIPVAGDPGPFHGSPALG